MFINDVFNSATKQEFTFVFYSEIIRSDKKNYRNTSITSDNPRGEHLNILNVVRKIPNSASTVTFR